MTAARAFFERELLPAFAVRFRPDDLVLNLGAGLHSYREWFSCRVVTADIDPATACDHTFPAEHIEYATGSVDGVLFVGVFERLDDPMQAMREVYRVLTPGGVALFSALDLGFPYRKPCDRWRLTYGGAAYVVRAFEVLAAHNIDGGAHFFVLKKP